MVGFKEPEEEGSFLFAIKLLIHAESGSIYNVNGKEASVHFIREVTLVEGKRSDKVVTRTRA